MKKLLLVPVLIALIVALAGWGARTVFDQLAVKSEETVPVTKVKRGSVVFSVVARGNLQGGNSKTLTAPMTGNAMMTITHLAKPGDVVSEGDVVAQFDTAEEEFKLKEAEADLAEAEQQVLQASNEALAREEELNYELIKARADLRLAEIECEKNELLPVMVQKQNMLSLEANKDRVKQLEHDYPERKAAAKASIAIQEAARKKAQVQSETAKRNISLMTLKAPVAGYVNVERNTQSNFMYPGMVLPVLQLGDQIRAGMGVVQIPDLKTWEIPAQISEEDRGHLSVGQPAEIEVVSQPGRKFHGKVTNIGGTTGPPWNRRFEAKLSLEDPVESLRPGMSVLLTIRTQTVDNALWLPGQALFETGDHKQVYLRGASGFVAKDVELVRRSESQVVIKGLNEGDVVALINPSESTKKQDKAGEGALKAIPK